MESSTWDPIVGRIRGKKRATHDARKPRTYSLCRRARGLGKHRSMMHEGLAPRQALNILGPELRPRTRFFCGGRSGQFQVLIPDTPDAWRCAGMLLICLWLSSYPYPSGALLKRPRICPRGISARAPPPLRGADVLPYGAMIAHGMHDRLLMV